MDVLSLQAGQQVRNALRDLRAHNGHHRFEDLCRHYARLAISRQILPPTGPVGAGGDQGRDFESFRSFIDSGLPGSSGPGRSGVIVGQCTLQVSGLRKKIESDIRKIVSGGPVTLICYFTEQNIPDARAHEIQAWARSEHQVELDIYDGNKLAGVLSERTLYTMASKYLPLPRWESLHPDGRQQPRSSLPSGQTLLVSMLPTGPRRLIGRQAEIDQALRWLTTDREADEATPPVVVISGPPGAGKTALAVSIARAAALSFPDGQFWIEGPDAGADDATTSLLSLLLTALEGDPALVPAGRAEKLMRLRLLLAGRRALIVLDDLGSEAMLRELASISGPFAVIVTSRYRLTGLAGDGVRYLNAGPLAQDDAARLALLIADRLTEGESRELAAACGGLAVAVSIAASLIARRPSLDVSRYLRQIASGDHGINELRAGQASVEAVIEQSYRLLTAEQSRVMQVLGVLPNASIPVEVVAGALSSDTATRTPEAERRTARILDDLHELNLAEEPEDGRYRLHALLYQFARCRAAAESREWREQVTGNACLMYAGRVETAAFSIGYADAAARVPLESNAASIRALEQDRPGAVMMVLTAARAELWDHAVNLAHTLTPALDHLCHWQEMRQVYEVVREAGERTGNSGWLASALLNLGTCAARNGRSDEAVELYRQCWEVASSAGDLFTATAAYNGYGDLMLSLGHADQAIPMLRRALRTWRLTGNDVMLVRTLHSMGAAWVDKARLDRAESFFRNALRVAETRSITSLLPTQGTALAMVLRLTGRIDEAREQSRVALERARVVGDRQAEAAALRETSFLLEEPGEDDPLATALEAYRELGDTRGELQTLATLGASAEDAGDTGQAARWFDECLNLAVKVGDATHLAIAIGHLAIANSMIGQHDKAQSLIGQAEEIAADTGNNRLVTQVHGYRTELLYKTGHTSQAIPLLQRSARLLTAAGESTALAQVQVQLGYALMNHSRWKEAHTLLRAVAEAPSDAVTKRTKASAWRVLAALYSRRDLSDEALDASRQALGLARKTGSPIEEMQCFLTSANILARMRQWNDAAAEYERALATAIDLHDTSTLAVILANQASCWREIGDSDKAISAMRAGIDYAMRLGAADLEASLRINFGTIAARQGRIADAITELARARQIAADLENSTLRATAAINLARAYRAQGDIERSHEAAREAREVFQAEGHPSGAAEALLLESGEDNPDTDNAAIVQETSAPAPDRYASPWIVTALSVTGRDIPEKAGRTEKEQREGRYPPVHIADTVRAALKGYDIDDIFRQLAGDRRSCFACTLPIVPDGQAEALLVQSESGGHELLTLAHPACMPSSVVQVASPIAGPAPARLEIECTILSEGTPAIVVDCRGQRVAGDDGRVIDPFLATLQQMGFVSARQAVSPGPLLEFTLHEPSALRARLVRDRLTISAADQAVMADAQLCFLPQWYRATRAGIIVAMFGRNLQGMSYDDPTYLIRAVNSGNLVVAAIPLNVVPPGRNERCMCTPPTNRKFKHCCGRPDARPALAAHARIIAVETQFQGRRQRLCLNSSTAGLCEPRVPPHCRPHFRVRGSAFSERVQHICAVPNIHPSGKPTRLCWGSGLRCAARGKRAPAVIPEQIVRRVSSAGSPALAAALVRATYTRAAGSWSALTN